ERAHRGDPGVLPLVGKVFDEHPEMVGKFGDLAHYAEEALLTLASGPSLVAREAFRRQQAALRQRLQAAADSDLEELLVGTISLSHLEVHLAQIDLAQQRRKQAGAAPEIQAAEKRLDHAQRRYLASIQKLATVRKLLRPTPSPGDGRGRAVHQKGHSSQQ